MRKELERYWDELHTAMRATSLAAIAEIGEELFACYQRGGMVFLAGNGGSAATASHLACDLAKGTRVAGMPAFRVVALTDNVPLMTAWANDTSYDRIFAEQLSALARPGDVVLLISASGNSPNIVAIPEMARQLGVKTLALTGQSGGKLARLADLTVKIPAGLIEQVEDAHMMIAHSLCVALRQRMQRESEEANTQVAIPSRRAMRLARVAARPTRAALHASIVAMPDDMPSGGLAAIGDEDDTTLMAQ